MSVLDGAAMRPHGHAPGRPDSNGAAGRNLLGAARNASDWDDHLVGLAGELLERAARAWPVADERWLDGWWLRHTDSEPWWSGAVLAHADGGGLEGRLAATERFYAERSDWPRFQVCPDCPPALDPLLQARGYAGECAVVLMTARAPASSADARGPAVEVRVQPSLTPPGWRCDPRVTPAPARRTWRSG